MALKNPIGAKITSPDFNGQNGEEIIYTVVGVAKDFHYQSLHQKIEPLVFVNAEKFHAAMGTTGVRIKADNFRSAVEAIEKTWKSFVPEHPFHYNFLDKTLADQYKAEQTTQRIFTIFSMLAIFIACMGLLGLAAYATQLRVREISIRKVLGSNRRQLSFQFLSETAIITIGAVAIAVLIAVASLPYIKSLLNLPLFFNIAHNPAIPVFLLAIAICVTLLSGFYPSLVLSGFNPVTALKNKFNAITNLIF